MPCHRYPNYDNLLHFTSIHVLTLFSPISYSVICLDSVLHSQEIRELKCLHVFHQECLEKWYLKGHYDCPLCHRTYFVQGRRSPTGSEWVWMVWMFICFSWNIWAWYMAFLFYTHYSIRVPGLFDMHCTEMYIVALGYNGWNSVWMALTYGDNTTTSIGFGAALNTVLKLKLIQPDWMANRNWLLILLLSNAGLTKG